MKSDEKEARKKYNLVGKHYHNWRTKIYPKGWVYNEMLEMPATFELLGNIKGKKVLDIGCGAGIYARLMTKNGAKVKGFDITPTMLEIAKRENPQLDLRLGSINKIPFREKFDIAIAPLVLDYLQDWDKPFKEVKRILKKGGYFIFSCDNPVVEVTSKISKNKPLIRKFGNYFEEKKYYNTWRNILSDKKFKDIEMPGYHKTYETIIKTILKNGFEIINYQDCKVLPEAKKPFPKQYNFLSKVPYFCVWKVRKK